MAVKRCGGIIERMDHKRPHPADFRRLERAQHGVFQKRPAEPRALLRSIDGTVSGGEIGWRLPAREIERIVAESARSLLADRSTLTRVVRDGGMAAHRISGLLNAISLWTGDHLDLVERINVAPDRLALSLKLSPLSNEADMIVRHVVPIRIRRRGVETKLVLEENGSMTSNPDPALIKAVVRAHRWLDDLASGRARTLGEIAQKEGVSDRYVSKLIPLSFLAPDIVEAILGGTQPVDLTAETLTKHTDIPLRWSEQETLFGFDRQSL